MAGMRVLRGWTSSSADPQGVTKSKPIQAPEKSAHQK